LFHGSSGFFPSGPWFLILLAFTFIPAGFVFLCPVLYSPCSLDLMSLFFPRCYRQGVFVTLLASASSQCHRLGPFCAVLSGWSRLTQSSIFLPTVPSPGFIGWSTSSRFVHFPPPLVALICVIFPRHFDFHLNLARSSLPPFFLTRKPCSTILVSTPAPPKIGVTAFEVFFSTSSSPKNC